MDGHHRQPGCWVTSPATLSTACPNRPGVGAGGPLLDQQSPACGDHCRLLRRGGHPRPFVACGRQSHAGRCISVPDHPAALLVRWSDHGVGQLAIVTCVQQFVDAPCPRSAWSSLAPRVRVFKINRAAGLYFPHRKRTVGLCARASRELARRPDRMRGRDIQSGCRSVPQTR